MHHQHSIQRRAALLSLVVSFSVVSAWADSENDNLRNFRKVDDHVYRGAQPTDAGFQELARLGVKTIIDLREVGEHSQADEQKVVTGLGMRYVSIPMHGLSTPKDDLVAKVQAIFNDATNGPVFVHCKRGADRTGMVVAVYRISHDQWDNKKALSEAKSYGMSIFERAIQHYVKDYKPAVALAAVGTEAASTLVSSRGVR